MAKRKRLSPANPAIFGATETKSAATAPSASRAPIADVASEAAATAALNEVTREMAQARDAGRMVLQVPLEHIRLDHLVRDRIVSEDDDMEALVASLAARGQQTPIEVMPLAPGRYGLISGWRRCQALLRLTEDGQHDGTVLALQRMPAEASQAYLAMVEENEIRVGLSYFERARVAAKAVEQGVFKTEKAALLSLFQSASRPKRSKIRSFLPLVAAFDGVLAFPHHIGERLGLRLSAALAADPDLAGRICAAIERERPETGEAEQALLAKALDAAPRQDIKPDTKPPEAKSTTSEGKTSTGTVEQRLGDGLVAQWREGEDWLTLRGAEMTPKMRDRLIAYIRRLPRS